MTSDTTEHKVRHELYDLAKDPGENDNRYEQEAGRRAALATKLDAWLAEVAARGPIGP